MKRLFVMLSLMLCFAMSGCFNGSRVQEQPAQEEEVVLENTVDTAEVDTLCIDMEEADTLCVDEQVME